MTPIAVWYLNRATVEEVASPPSRMVTTVLGPTGGASGSPVTSSIRTRQPPSGAGPATAMSPPRETRQPLPVRRVIAAAARSAVRAFAVAPRSTRTPGAIRTRRSRASSSIRCQPGAGEPSTGPVAATAARSTS